MAATPAFIAELGRRFNLSPEEMMCLERAGVRSIDAAHSILTTGTQLDGSDSPRLQGIRRTVVLGALEPHLSTRYREAVDRWQQRRTRRTSGAAPPSVEAAGALVALTVLEDGHVPRGAERLHRRAAIDLVAGRGQEWAVRDQDERPTCIAFAAAACLELLRAKQGKPFEELSAQFLYWNMRSRPPQGPLPPDWEEGATKLGQAKDVLAAVGVCTSARCSYIAPLPDDAPVEGDAPDAAAFAEALGNRVPNSFYRDFPQDAARLIYEQLEQGRPVALALPQFAATATETRTNWNDPWVLSTGEVFNPLPGMTQASGHAVCITAFQPDPAEPMGGWFIFKNSLSTRWAEGAPDPSGPLPYVPQRGYGALSATYVEKYSWEIFSPILA